MPLAPPLRIRLLLAILAGAAGACAAEAPRGLVAIDYTFAESRTAADFGAAGSTDSEVTAWSLGWELLQISDNANLMIGATAREDQLDAPGQPSFRSRIVRTQLRWHFQLAESVQFYAGPGFGLAVSVEGPAPASYHPAWVFDAETGLRFWIDPRFGVQAFANYSRFELDGRNPASPSGRVDGVGMGAGLFFDF
ncbi:MAG TPA: hypothetical protein VGC54_09175 [Planctomycetota bacterium]